MDAQWEQTGALIGAMRDRGYTWCLSGGTLPCDPAVVPYVACFVPTFVKGKQFQFVGTSPCIHEATRTAAAAADTWEQSGQKRQVP